MSAMGGVRTRRLRVFAGLALALMLHAPLALALAGDAPDGGARATGPRDAPAASSSAPAAPGPAMGTRVEDPEGDAREWNSNAATAPPWGVCSAGGDAGLGACGTAYYSAGNAGVDPEPVGGIPASPVLDVVAVQAEETASEVLVTIEVASLDADFGGAVSQDRRQFLAYQACWVTIPSDACREWAQVNVARRANGSIGVTAYVIVAYPPDEAPGTRCVAPAPCLWRVPADFVPGSPGAITVHVPRDLLLRASPGDSLMHLSGSSWRGMGSASIYAGYDVAGEWGEAYESIYYVVDATQEAPDHEFTTAVGTSPDGMPDGLWEAPRFPALRPTLALLGARLTDNATHAQLGIQLELVEERSSEELLYLIVATMRTGERVAFQHKVGDGEPRSRAWTMHETPNGTVQVDIPFALDVREGPGGWIGVSLDRRDLGSPRKGDAYSAVNALVIGWDEVAPVEEIQFYNINALRGSVLPVHRFLLDTATDPATMRPASVLLVDDAGDAVLPPLATRANGDQLDITSIDLTAEGDASTRVTLGIRDLSSVQVPLGYDSVLYAVSVETGAGPFMAAFWKTRSGIQEFFCASDKVVLTSAKLDPVEIVRTEIEGIVASSGTSRGGGASPGSFILQVPHACFGVEAPGTFDVQRIAAGTYLIQGSGVSAQVTTVDEFQSNEPRTLGALAPPRAAERWWVAPFGLDAFWSLLALAAVGGGGLLAILSRARRRTALQRELRALHEAHARHKADPAAWKLASAERRAHAAELLRRGRLRADEVLVIERRAELLAAEVVQAPRPAAGFAPGALLLERYELQRLLGEGSQGRAFLAGDITLQRDVVVKVVHTSGLEGSARRALLAEARLAGAIGHPNVVRVHDVREEGPEALLILEFVEGGSLRDLLARRTRLPTAEAVAIAGGILHGLQAAHERGIVHRDVKPENVLLARDGTPKLADFGAARDIRRDATSVAQGVGTLTYMSPEQVRGAHVDARSDLYSVGAVLVEMLTGAPYLPLGQVDQFQARAMILEKAPDVRFPEGALPLTGVALRALAKNPSERYQSAAEMLAALDAATP